MTPQARWAAFAKPEHYDWTWTFLNGAYSAQDRHYHDLHHIDACLSLLDRVADPLVDKEIAALALFWHDVVYVPGTAISEEMSANLLGSFSEALSVDGRCIGFARKCILATRHTESWKFSGNPTVDTVLDIDLSILGASPSVYDSYVHGVRREFIHVPSEAWRTGRGAFLREMLARWQIYLTEALRDWFEFAARSNMKRELDTLEVAHGEGE